MFLLLHTNTTRTALHIQDSVRRQKEVRIGDEMINVRYADDTVLVAENTEVQELLHRVKEGSNRWGLSITINKIKFSVVCKVDVGQPHSTSPIRARFITWWTASGKNRAFEEPRLLGSIRSGE